MSHKAIYVLFQIFYSLLGIAYFYMMYKHVSTYDNWTWFEKKTKKILLVILMCVLFVVVGFMFGGFVYGVY